METRGEEGRAVGWGEEARSGGVQGPGILWRQLASGKWRERDYGLLGGQKSDRHLGWLSPENR